MTCCWYIEVFRIIWVEAPTSGDQSGQGLSFYSLDAHVNQGGLCYRVLGIKTKGEDCVKCPDPMYLTRQELVWEAVFKGQDSRMCLKAVSSGAEVAEDGPGALPLLCCCRSVVDKAIKQRFRCLSYIHFRTFRTNDAVDKTGTFTGEGVSEIEGKVLEWMTLQESS